MKSKITLILGIIDALLVTAVIGMLILNGINSQTVEPRFDTKKVIKEANTSKDPKQPHLCLLYTSIPQSFHRGFTYISFFYRNIYTKTGLKTANCLHSSTNNGTMYSMKKDKLGGSP